MSVGMFVNVWDGGGGGGFVYVIGSSELLSSLYGPV